MPTVWIMNLGWYSVGVGIAAVGAVTVAAMPSQPPPDIDPAQSFIEWASSQGIAVEAVACDVDEVKPFRISCYGTVVGTLDMVGAITFPGSIPEWVPLSASSPGPGAANAPPPTSAVAPPTSAVVPPATDAETAVRSCLDALDPDGIGFPSDDIMYDLGFGDATSLESALSACQNALDRLQTVQQSPTVAEMTTCIAELNDLFVMIRNSYLDGITMPEEINYNEVTRSDVQILQRLLSGYGGTCTVPPDPGERNFP
jgi:hypothetical protein